MLYSHRLLPSIRELSVGNEKMRITFDKVGQINVSSEKTNFARIANELEQIEIGKDLAYPAETDYDFSPWNGLLKEMRIKGTEGPVLAELDSDSLLIHGSPENLKKMASFMTFPEGAFSGFHNHYEWYEGNPYIHSDCLSLIFELIESPANQAVVRNGGQLRRPPFHT